MKNINCFICKKKINDLELGSIDKLENKNIFKCRECSRKTIKMMWLPEVMIVAVKRDSLDWVLKNKKYFFPEFYKRKGGKYLAFYVSEPISAITYYAKVKSIFKNVLITDLDDIKHVSKLSRGDLVRLFDLEWIKKLHSPIKRLPNESPIQGRRNTTLKILFNSKSLSDLVNKND